ncbi:MAG: AsmA family protein [Sedimenticolaceae bacterium]
MGTLLKWLFGLIIVLVLLIAAAVVVLPMVVDPNDYKPQIVAKAKDQLGRDLVIDEDLSLSVFPWLGIETGGVRMGNAAGFKAEWFAEIDRLGLKVKLMPLLSRQVEVDNVLVKGLRLNLEKDAKGQTNWADLAARQDEPAPPDATEQPVDQGPPFAFSVQGIEIDDARVSWDDRQSGQQYVVEGARLVTGALAPGVAVPIEAAMTFTSGTPAMTLKAKLDASVESDADLKAFRIAGLVLALDAAGEGLPKGGAELTLKTNLAVDTKADTLRLDQLEISGPALSARGELAVTALQTNPAAKGKLSIAETNLKTLASMFASPIETTDPAAMTRASGDLVFAYADGALKLDPLKIRLDESQLDGHLFVLDPNGPVVRTKLALDQIDLDRYMPPAQDKPQGAAEPAPAAKAAEATPPAADPFAALRTLDFVGEFTIGQLKVGNARMSNVATKVVSKKGVLTVDPMAANLYEGTFAGRVVVDASGKQPKLQAKNRLTDIQVGPLLKDVANEERLLGRGEVEVDLQMVGLSESEIRRSLNGNARFLFNDGAYKGVNIAQLIRDASSRLGLGSDKIDTGTPGQTDFAELSGSFKITDGVIENRDLQAKSPLLRIDGNGEVDLPKDTVDYLITTTLVGSLAGQGGKGRDELAGVPIPVRVSGPLTKPSFRPDLEAALSAKAKAAIDEKKVELQNKAEEKVKEKLDGVLKGLFK